MNGLSPRTLFAGIIIAGGLLTGIAITAMVRMMDKNAVGGNALIVVLSLIGLIAIIFGFYHLSSHS